MIDQSMCESSLRHSGSSSRLRTISVVPALRPRAPRAWQAALTVDKSVVAYQRLRWAQAERSEFVDGALDHLRARREASRG
jgi:hypothetical protein